MRSLFSYIIPSLKTIKILGDAKSFESWIITNYPNVNTAELFKGYQFSINCCLNTFIDGISCDNFLGLESDFLFERALSNLIPIHQLDSSCEKTIFLKNIKPFVTDIRKAKTYAEIGKYINIFEQEITLKFDQILDENIIIKEGINIDKDTVIKLLLIDFLHTYLVQINNNGPTANVPNLLAVHWTKKKEKEAYFEGYKYAIQFLSYKLLGKTKYNKTSLVSIHNADSWREYKYIKTDSESDSEFAFMNEQYHLEEQTCFDSYFDRIKNEITNPLYLKYKIPIYTIESSFSFNSEGYNKTKIFSEFLNIEKIKKYTPNFNVEEGEEIRQKLLWYPIQIIDAENLDLHSGIPSFNTMLAGTVALHDPKESEFALIYVARFTHPTNGNNNYHHFSYGILVDTKSSAGHYSSGWIIYQNACGDNSGFSGSEHKFTEKLIAKYEKTGKIALISITITLSKFKDFTKKYFLTERQLSIVEQNKLISQIINCSRSYLFELFTFYVLYREYNVDYKIELNVDKNNDEGEKDVLLQRKDESEVILVECKITPQNTNMEKLLNKLILRLNNPKYNGKLKSIQLWFWNEPTAKNIEVLEKNNSRINIKVVCVSNPRGEKLLKNVDMSSIRYIMQNYNNSNNENFEEMLKKYDVTFIDDSVKKYTP